MIRTTDRFTRLLLALLIPLCAFWAIGSSANDPVNPVDIGIIVNPYAGDRAGPELDADAAAMAEGGLEQVIAAAGGRIQGSVTVALTETDERQYGRWNRFGLASGHLADMASANQRAGFVNLGLYNNCSSLMGMLGGLRHSADPPVRVGLVWIDAHGDYNTPETTLSGMLGGMPVWKSLCQKKISSWSAFATQIPSSRYGSSRTAFRRSPPKTFAASPKICTSRCAG